MLQDLENLVELQVADKEILRLKEEVAALPKRVAVIDADTGSTVASLPIGEGTDFAEFDPVRRRAFSSNRDGTLSVIAEKSADSFEALPPVQTAFGARTMAVDQQNGRLFQPTRFAAATPPPPPTPGTLAPEGRLRSIIPKS